MTFIALSVNNGSEHQKFPLWSEGGRAAQRACRVMNASSDNQMMPRLTIKCIYVTINSWDGNG